MPDPGEPPRPRDDALESELESLHKQEEEGHATPKEQRRAEQLEHRLGSTSTARTSGNAGRRTVSWTVRTPRNATATATDPPRRSPGPVRPGEAG